MTAQAVIVPPAVEPVSLDEMKLWMKLDDDSIEDALITDLIATARAAAELYTGRAFITQTIRLTAAPYSRRSEWTPGYYDLPVDFFDGELARSIHLPTQPVRSIISVTTYGADNVATPYPSSNYALIGPELTLNAGSYWPSASRTAVIVYVAGYGDAPGDVPSPIRTAIKMHVASMYEDRGQCCDDVPGKCMQLLRHYRIDRL